MASGFTSMRPCPFIKSSGIVDPVMRRPSWFIRSHGLYFRVGFDQIADAIHRVLVLLLRLPGLRITRPTLGCGYRVGAARRNRELRPIEIVDWPGCVVAEIVLDL